MPSETETSPAASMVRARQSGNAASQDQARINELENQLLRMSEVVDRLQQQLTIVPPSAAPAGVATQSTPVFANDIDAQRWQSQAQERIKAAKLRKLHEQGWKAEEDLFAGKHKFLCVYGPEPMMTRVVGCDYDGGIEAQGVCEVKFRQYFGITGFAAGQGLTLSPFTGTEEQLPERQRQRRKSLRDSLAS